MGHNEKNVYINTWYAQGMEIERGFLFSVMGITVPNKMCNKNIL